MTLFDRLFLLATGLVAIFLILRFLNDYRNKPRVHKYDLYYLTSFGVLLVAGLLLIFLGYGVLDSPLVVVVAALIPLSLSTGLVAEFFPQYEKPYLAFAVIGFIALAVTRFTGPAGLATLVLIIVHTIAGLTVFGLPLALSLQGKTSKGFIGVTVGGALIGLGGIALAFLKTGRQLLFFSPQFVFAILAPLLFLMTLAFAWGFVKEAY
jgi:hypothetical protein